MRHKSSEKDDFHFANIPRRLEADCHPVLGPRLAGLPVNLVYTGIRKDPNGRTLLIAAEYLPNPQIFEEILHYRRIAYLSKIKSPYWVEILHDKENDSWRIRKFKDKQLIFETQANGFEQAIYQTTKVGVQEDEPGDSFVLD